MKSNAYYRLVRTTVALFVVIPISGTLELLAQELPSASPSDLPPAAEATPRNDGKEPPAIDSPTTPSENSEPIQEDPNSEIDGEALIREKMRIFRAYEGEWEGVQFYSEAEGNPPYESKGEWTGSFQLEGMYFEMDGYSDYQSGRSSYRWMITYDLLLEQYRGWTFNSNGMVTDWLAKYDVEQKELKWRFVDPRTGIRGSLRTQAAKPNLVTGHGMAKTEGARVLSDYRLEFKRKKLRI